MEIKKIAINQFKSINHFEIEVQKFGDSYTQMLIGINESGKSNILHAMSMLNVPTVKCDYNVYHNQKDEDKNPIEIFFHLKFEKKQTYRKRFEGMFEGGKVPGFEVSNIVKRVYLDRSAEIFSAEYNYIIGGLPENKYFHETTKKVTINGQTRDQKIIEFGNSSDETNELLTEESLKRVLNDRIIAIIKQFEPKITLWKPSEEYLISEVDLNEFVEDIDSNIPLRHIFVLAGYVTQDEIEDEIGNITNQQLRRRLEEKLSDSTTKYIKNIWNHKVKFDVEISETGQCGVSVKDEGHNNRFNFHKMSARSEGFKQFLSLILSLSIESKKLNQRNRLILIDEPEAHLHPSGIRDLRKELLQIGKNNYVFISTHSPFLVDRTNKERNVVIKKNNNAESEKKRIASYEDIRDDEVLEEAFGINVYKDLLIPHRLLVEGMSDRVIFLKVFSLLGLDYGVTNGTGSNIVQIASRLNNDDISTLVIVDDDDDGHKYKDDILKIGGVFCEKNVFTIRDLVGEIKPKGTIEDVLPKEYVERKYKELYKAEWDVSVTFELDETPFIQQIKIQLQKDEKYTKDFLDRLKKNISDDFNPSKAKFSEKNPLLDKLVNEIDKKLK